MFKGALLALAANAIVAASACAETSVADFYRNKNIDVYSKILCQDLNEFKLPCLTPH